MFYQAFEKKDFFFSINREEKNQNRERKIHKEGGILGLKRDDHAKKNLTLKPSLSSQPAAPLEGQNKNNKSLAPSLAEIQLPSIHQHRPAKHPDTKTKSWPPRPTHSQPLLPLFLWSASQPKLASPSQFFSLSHRERRFQHPSITPEQLHKAFPVQQLLFSPLATFVSPSVSSTIAIAFQPIANRSSLLNWPQTHGLPLQPQMSFLLPPDRTSTSHLHRSFSGHRWQQQPDLPSAEEKTNREEKRTEGFEQI